MLRRLLPTVFLRMVSLLLVLGVAGSVWADDGPPPEEGPAPEEPVVGVITGNRVNVRVGPRVDNRPVARLDEGAVVIAVEQRGQWVGVLVPSGLAAVVSTDYTVPEGPDKLRVKARKLNLRVHPPEKGKPAPGIFLDHPENGTLLTLIELVEPSVEGTAGGIRSGGWAWVIAPEGTRAFVHERYVKRLGPLSEHTERVEAARARRTEGAKLLIEARHEAARQASGLRLMEILGAVQQDLYRLRQAGGTDKAPIVALANRMDEVLEEEDQAVDRVLRLARALREDLEREIQLRVARHDAELARTQGLNPPTVPLLDEVQDDVVLKGTIRYEPTPGWTEEGVHFLWIDGRPCFALRLTTGGPLPHPEFNEHVDGGLRRVEGRRPGSRLFGLPVLEVRRIGTDVE